MGKINVRRLRSEPLTIRDLRLRRMDKLLHGPQDKLREPLNRGRGRRTPRNIADIMDRYR